MGIIHQNKSIILLSILTFAAFVVAKYSYRCPNILFIKAVLRKTLLQNPLEQSLDKTSLQELQYCIITVRKEKH